MKLLVTAFEPFGGASVNPTQEALALLPEEMDGCRIVKAVVPVTFRASIPTVRDITAGIEAALRCIITHL